MVSIRVGLEPVIFFHNNQAIRSFGSEVIQIHFKTRIKILFPLRQWSSALLLLHYFIFDLYYGFDQALTIEHIID
jgi:hypothetical protein